MLVEPSYTDDAQWILTSYYSTTISYRAARRIFACKNLQPSQKKKKKGYLGGMNEAPQEIYTRKIWELIKEMSCSLAGVCGRLEDLCFSMMHWPILRESRKS